MEDKVKNDADIPAALDKWLVKLREIDSVRAEPVEPWVKVLAIKKIIPDKTVEIINARDDLSGTDAIAYDRILKWFLAIGNCVRAHYDQLIPDEEGEELGKQGA